MVVKKDFFEGLTYGAKTMEEVPKPWRRINVGSLRRDIAWYDFE